MNSHKMLNEQERQELAEGLEIPQGGYKHRESMIREQLEEKIDDEGFRILDVFPDRVFFETENGIFESQYSFDEDSVELSGIVKLNETIEQIEERLRSGIRKRLHERKMAGLSPKSEIKGKSLLLEQQKPIDESNLTDRQIKDRKIAGLM